jgi:hypothetical protein
LTDSAAILSDQATAAQRSKHIVLRAGLIFAALAPSFATAAELPRLGDYLDTAYIHALQKTHSPLAAAREDTVAHMPQMVSVQAQGSARRFAASYEWHRGTILFVLQRNGTIHREMSWGPDPATALRVLGPEDFCLAPPGAAPHCYHYIKRVNDAVAGIVLAGRYMDRQGAAYTFSADGRSGQLLTLYKVGAPAAGAFGTPDFTQKLAVLRQAAPVRLLASR